MSTRNGPHARAEPAAADRSPGSGRTTMRHGRAEDAGAPAPQEEVARAEADYRRLRHAYRAILHKEPDHEVALAMIGADLDRAHTRLQALGGLPRARQHE